MFVCYVLDPNFAKSLHVQDFFCGNFVMTQSGVMNRPLPPTSKLYYWHKLEIFAKLGIALVWRRIESN